MAERYYDIVEQLIGEARKANRAAVPAAASIIADTVAADGIVRAITDDVRAFRGEADPFDDLTLLVTERRRPGAGGSAG